MAKLAIKGGKPVRTKPLGVAWPIYDEREIEALAEVVRSGEWGGTPGREVREFEREFADFCDAKHAICLTNGTAALEVSLRAVG
ncbi:MAG TPA: DegT/DnrJ/EryC1/StrS aminotransferase family protein, partial [Armatimonadetes bacterium]|nr:DegT/DnrJ/EryC1/StrS aminotransferase family protein [Armatimonadota bacterium]